MAYSHLSLYEDFKNTVCGQIESTDWYKSMTTNQDRYDAYEACGISILDAAKDENVNDVLEPIVKCPVDEETLSLHGLVGSQHLSR